MTFRQIGARITKIREERGLTTIKLGLAADMPPAQVSRLESGHQGLGVKALLRLSDALRIHPCYFYMNDEEWKIFQQVKSGGVK